MHPAKRPYFAMATMAALFAALPVLAWLQYRWIGEAGRAELERTRAGLRRSAAQFASDFDAELARLHLTVMSDPEPEDRNRQHYVDRLSEWRTLSSHPELLQSLYLSEGGPAGLDVLLQFDNQRGFRPVTWPTELEPLRADLQTRVAERPPPAYRGPPGMNADLAVLVAPRVPRNPRPELAQPPPEFRPGDPDPQRGEGPPRQPPRPGDERPPPRERPGFPPPRGVPPGAAGWVIAVLDLDYIHRVWAPELVKKYFAAQDQPDYDVRIVSDRSGKIIYESDPAAPAGAFAKPDAEVPMFALRPGPVAVFRPQGGPPATRDPVPGRWRLQVRDHSGGVDAVVARGRARDLAVSGAVLLIMAASLVALGFAIRRSAQLAARQMQFVAAVSHELRTPLAVIRSAAENLADGIVTSGDSVKEYGALIREEGRRLSYLIEQTLRLAGIQAGRARFNLVPASIPAAIEDAMKSCESTLKAAGCAVETNIEAGLPPVPGDASALAVCVGNLLTNAARHAKSGGWIGVSAARSGNTVRIDVRDRGPGIEARDLPHIFEPFYRGRTAESGQVGGTGLGLALVRQIITAHNGEVAVDSRPGQGACFTLTLPVAAGADSI